MFKILSLPIAFASLFVIDNTFDETLEISSFETTTAQSAFTEHLLLAATVISTPEVVFQEVKGWATGLTTASFCLYHFDLNPALH